MDSLAVGLGSYGRAKSRPIGVGVIVSLVLLLDRSSLRGSLGLLFRRSNLIDGLFGPFFEGRRGVKWGRFQREVGWVRV